MGNERVAKYFAAIRARLIDADIENKRIIGTEIRNYSIDAFTQQAWNGKPWKKRVNAKNDKPLLIGSGILRNSITYETFPDRVIVKTGAWPYAKIHNEGGIITRQSHSDTFIRPRMIRGERKGKFRALTRKEKEAAPVKGGFTFKKYQIQIPQRQYLGIPPQLKRKILKEIKAVTNKAIKGE